LLGYLYFAEKHGDISFALLEGSSILEKKLEHTEKFKKVIKYPIFLIFFVGFMITVIEKVLVPQFQTLYSSMNYKETFLSNLLFNISSINRSSLIFLLALLLIFVCYYFFYFKHLHPNKKMRVLLKFPVLNQ